MTSGQPLVCGSAMLLRLFIGPPVIFRIGVLVPTLVLRYPEDLRKTRDLRIGRVEVSVAAVDFWSGVRVGAALPREVAAAIVPFEPAR